MRIADVVTLIADNPNAHGVHDTPAEIRTKVCCDVQSIGMSEMYTARSQGLSPEWRLVIPHAFDYAGQRRCVFRGVEYDILRTYEGAGNAVELTIQRRNTADVG